MLPPIFSLGYHYSKWEKIVTASTLYQWNKQFTKWKIPVDSFWLDISYAGDSYFQFHPMYFEKKTFQ